MRSLPEKPAKLTFKKSMKQDLEELRDLFYEWAGNATALKNRRADPRAESFDKGCNEMATKCGQEVQNFIMRHYNRVRDAMSRR
jgi:hypothetical protein